MGFFDSLASIVGSNPSGVLPVVVVPIGKSETGAPAPVETDSHGVKVSQTMTHLVPVAVGDFDPPLRLLLNNGDPESVTVRASGDADSHAVYMAKGAQLRDVAIAEVVNVGAGMALLGAR